MSRARSEPPLSDGTALREPSAEKVVMRTYRKDLLEIPRAIAATVTMRDFFKLDAMARFTDAVVGIYSLGAVPANATWGARMRERFLCVDNLDASIWVIGCLEDASYETRAQYKPTLTVKVQLLRETDRLRLASLNHRTSPKSRELSDAEDTLVAIANIPDPQSVFRHLYDGSASFDFQANMGRLGVNDFVPGDIVLAECSFVRSSRDRWATWSVNFELQALTLLHRATRTSCGRSSRYRGGL
ncbi:hypothetical protein C8T65DRAFT_747420 [Cerioporus squamosus]|nr:hypothetical protein C8T65DRAFT_747420 [Cerioporus squamosus]